MNKIKAIILLLKSKDWFLITHEGKGIFTRQYETLHSMKNPSNKDQIGYVISWLEEEIKLLKRTINCE